MIKLPQVPFFIFLFAVGTGLLWRWYLQEVPNWRQTANIGTSTITFARKTGGMIEFWGRDEWDFAKGLGYAHAKDRLVQMFLQRILSAGKLSEYFDYNEKTVRVRSVITKMIVCFVLMLFL